jgi:hypothetical protein
LNKYIPTYSKQHSDFPLKGTFGIQGQKHLRYSPETPTFYQNDLAMRNTTDVIDGKPIAVWSQSIYGVRAVHLEVAFTTSIKELKVHYYFVLSRTSHETLRWWKKIIKFNYNQLFYHKSSYKIEFSARK